MNVLSIELLLQVNQNDFLKIISGNKVHGMQYNTEIKYRKT